MRGLIEPVYAGDELDGVPECLHAQVRKAEGERSAARSFAKSNLLKLDGGYAGSATVWTDDAITPTRLGQPVTVFRLGKIEGGIIVPWCRAEDGDSQRSWALSEVSIAKARADGIPEPGGVRAAMIEAAKAEWSEWEQKQPLLVLDATEHGWTGVVSKLGDEERRVRYDNRIGLREVVA